MWIWRTLWWLVFGPLVYNVCVEARYENVTIVAELSNFTSCGQGDKAMRCVHAASCNAHDQCACPNDSTGRGHFQCYRRGTNHLDVIASHLESSLHYDLAKAVPLFWPCKYRLNRIKTKGIGDLASCNVEVFGMNKPIQGSIFLYGVQIFMEFTFKSGDVRKEAVMKTGSAKNGIYHYSEWGKEFDSLDEIFKRDVSARDLDGSGSGANSFEAQVFPFADDEDFVTRSQWGEPRFLDLGEDIRTQFGTDSDGFAVLDLKSCGITIKFRPLNENSLYKEASGLSIAVKKGHGPESIPKEMTMEAKSLEELIHTDPSITQKQLTVSALRQAVPIDETEQGSVCQKSREIYQALCSDKSRIEKCSKLLSDSSLIGCLDRSVVNRSNRLMELFNLCLRVVCASSTESCHLARVILQLESCPNIKDTLKSFGCGKVLVTT